MFTSEPSLAQRIERMIRETPIVDPHSHVRSDQPNAPDLASLMSYHWVQTELKAVGLPVEDLDPKLPVEERVRRWIPYLAKMRNTAMSWCLFRIFRDLYDFHDPVLTESNYRYLVDKVAECSRTPGWAPSILRDRCNVRMLVTSLGNKSQDESKNPESLYYMLDAHYLFCPGVATDLEPFFVGRHKKEEYVEALHALLGETPGTPAQLEARLKDWLDRTVTGRVRFTNTFIPIEQRFLPPDNAQVSAALARAGKGQTLADGEIDELVRFVTWKVLEWHHDHQKAFQIAVGAEYFICDGKSIPRFQQTWTSEMARAFHTFGKARFDLMMASDVLCQEVTVLARQFPNVSVSGYWWHNFFPPLIEKNIALRLQVAPMTKWAGFLCDAYYVEWTYGKLQVVKKAMARAIASLVEMGYYEEDEIPSILFQVLHETPKSIYELG
jgi:glucuronate isomerase